MKGFSERKVVQVMYHYKLTYEQVLDKDLYFLEQAVDVINDEIYKNIFTTRVGVAFGISDILAKKKVSYKKLLEDIIL